MADPNPHEGQIYAHPDDGAVMNGGDEKMDGVAASFDVPPPPPPPEQEGQHQIVEGGDGSMPLMGANSNQLTLLFQGEVYVFESVTPEKVPPFSLILMCFFFFLKFNLLFYGLLLDGVVLTVGLKCRGKR